MAMVCNGIRDANRPWRGDAAAIAKGTGYERAATIDAPAIFPAIEEALREVGKQRFGPKRE